MCFHITKSRCDRTHIKHEDTKNAFRRFGNLDVDGKIILTFNLVK
jgi:hypothetical protein